MPRHAAGRAHRARLPKHRDARPAVRRLAPPAGPHRRAPAALVLRAASAGAPRAAPVLSRAPAPVVGGPRFAGKPAAHQRSLARSPLRGPRRGRRDRRHDCGHLAFTKQAAMCCWWNRKIPSAAAPASNARQRRPFLPSFRRKPESRGHPARCLPSCKRRARPCRISSAPPASVSTSRPARRFSSAPKAPSPSPSRPSWSPPAPTIAYRASPATISPASSACAPSSA